MFKFVESLFRALSNWGFCHRYPFWKMPDIWCEKRGLRGFVERYSTTWYDSIPSGWRKAFGIALSDDLKEACIAGMARAEENGKKASWGDVISIGDVKEKYGTLNIYASGSDTIQMVLDKYEHLSMGYCPLCGKPARYIMPGGYVLFICEECFEPHVRVRSCVPANGSVEDFKADHRLTRGDIPTITVYDGNGGSINTDPKGLFGIDLAKLWGLEGEDE